MPIIGTPLPGSNPGPLGGGGDNDLLILAPAMTLDIWADLQTEFGAQGGTPAVWRPYPQRHWNAVSSSIESFAAKRGTLIDLTTQIDVTDAIRAALDILAIDGFGLIVFTPGVGLISEIIEVTSDYGNIKLTGAGVGVTKLKLASGSNANGLFLFGDATGDWDSGTTLKFSGLSHMSLVGNKANNAPSSPTALLAVRNTENSDFTALETSDFEGWGIRAYGSHVNNSTKNQWSRLRARENVLGGGYWSDLKYNQFHGLLASNNNDGCGFKFGKATAEFTQNAATNIITNDNGVVGSASERSGVILDRVQRFSIAGIESNANGGAGLSAIDTPATGNNFSISGGAFRRNADLTGGDIVGIDLEGGSNVVLSGVTVQGGNPTSGTNLDKIGIRVADSSEVTIEGCNVTLINGRSILVEDSTGTKIEATCQGNGQDAGSTYNHTIHLVNADQTRLDITCRDNARTSGTDYEVYIDTGCNHVVFDSFILDAAADGNEIGRNAAVAGNQIVCDGGDGYMRANSSTVTVVNDSGTGTVDLPFGYEMYIIDMNGTDLNFVTPTRRQGTKIVIKIQSSGNDVVHNASGTGSLLFTSLGSITPFAGQVITLVADGSSWRSEQ